MTDKFCASLCRHFILILLVTSPLVSANDIVDWQLADYALAGVPYEIQVGKPEMVVPDKLEHLGGLVQKSNNNVAITMYKGELFVAFRTSKNHFASKYSHILVVRSRDFSHFILDGDFTLGRDLREPHFLEYEGKLNLIFTALGTSAITFKPGQSYRSTRLATSNWQAVSPILGAGEIIWDLKKRYGSYYLTSYSGPHYDIFGESRIQAHFKKTQDGVNFENVAGVPFIYQGGVSEIGFEFDLLGNVFGVTRNEDGDQSGFGSHIVSAPAYNLGEWHFPPHAQKNIYESPKMFRFGKDLFLIGRKNLARKPFGRASSKLPLFMQRLVNWIGYSLTAKTTALYKLDTSKNELIHISDLPGTGDNCFPSIVRLSPTRFLVANYTSPLDKKKISWIRGQLSKTSIYLITIDFKLRPK